MDVAEENEVEKNLPNYCPEFARAFEDIDGPETISRLKLIPSFHSLLQYFIDLRSYLVGYERKMNPFAPDSKLLELCTFMLERLRYNKDDTETYPKKDKFGYEISEYILDFKEFNLKSIHPKLAQFDHIALTHGGWVGTEPQIRVLTSLSHRFSATLELEDTLSATVIGFERNRYISSKRHTHHTYLRPWPLIVSVALFIHLSRITGNPLYIFNLPQISASLDNINSAYGKIYDLVRDSQKNVQLIVAGADRYKIEKIDRMTSRGIQPEPWANFGIIPYGSHTSNILTDFTERKKRGVYQLMAEPSFEAVDYRIIGF